MRRYRNARYAPESLERKLSPSAGVAAPAVSAVVAAPDATPAYTLNDPSTVIVIDSQGYGFDAGDYTPDVTLADNGAGFTYVAYGSDYLLVNTDGDGDVLSPDDVLPPALPPLNPAGPLLPA